MIEANHKKIWELFFTLYSGFMLRKIFHDVRVHFPHPSTNHKPLITKDSLQNNTAPKDSLQNNTTLNNSSPEQSLDYNISNEIDSSQDNNKSVLMIANHIFFWDGFVQMLLARKFFNKKIFIMMLEEQLSKRLFLTHAGCFSVKKSSRDLINSLNYAHSKLENPSNMVLIFPQGEIQSLYTTQIKFEKGVEYILKKEPNCNIWFNVNLINFYSRKKPTLNIYLEEFNTIKPSYPASEIPSPASDIRYIENAFNEFTAKCRSQESEVVKGEPLI
jgi:1-acyl-sn-glycerol-3-phosphate acyltransferase